MSAAIAAARADGDIIINGAEAVEKSYPGFFSDYTNLGGKANVITLE
jgi:3-phosphoshikimate 1-carboxyvinyltransferase